MGWDIFRSENPFRGITDKEATQEAKAILDASRSEGPTKPYREKRSSTPLTAIDSEFVDRQIDRLLQIYKQGERLEPAVQAVRTHLAERGLRLGDKSLVGQIVHSPSNAVIHNPLNVDWRTCHYRVLLPPIVDEEGIVAGPWLVAVQDHFSKIDERVFK